MSMLANKSDKNVVVEWLPYYYDVIELGDIPVISLLCDTNVPQKLYFNLL